MKKYILINIITLLFANVSSFAQKIISEGTIIYSIKIKNIDKANTIIDSATSTIYLKGPLSRTDMVNSLGNETTIYNAKTGSAVILKQYSGQKLMITLTKENRDNKYNKYDGIIFKPATETKNIKGYVCKQAIAQLKNGTTFSVYYTPDINVVNKEYDPVFKTLPGLPIQYEFVKGNLSFSYTISSLDFNTISSVKFDIPKSGYRVMTYEESEQNKN
jgi:GLPGLI family protein